MRYKKPLFNSNKKIHLRNKSQLNSQRGFAVMTTILLVLSVVVVMLTGFSIITVNVAKSSTNIVKSAEAYYAAEAAAEDALLRFMDSSYSPPLGSPDPGSVYTNFLSNSLKTGSSNITVIDDGTGIITVKSKGDTSSRFRNLKIIFDTTPVFTYAVMSSGDMEMGFNTTIHCVPTASECSDGSDDKGSVYVNGNLWANGVQAESANDDSLIKGNLYVTGTIDIKPATNWEYYDWLPSTNYKEWGLGYDSNCQEDRCSKSIAQSFIADVSLQTWKGAIFMKKIGNPGPLIAHFVKVANNTPKSKGRSDIDTTVFTYKIDNEAASGFIWVYFNFDPRINTDSNKKHWLVLQPNGGIYDKDNHWVVQYYDAEGDSENQYPRGQASYSSDVYFYSNNSYNPNEWCVQSGEWYAWNGMSDPCNDGRQNDITADFLFRMYYIGPADRQTSSVAVQGNVEADTAIGVDVLSGGSSNRGSFTGNKFIGLYYKHPKANNSSISENRIQGDSWANIYDSCDILRAGAAYSGHNFTGSRMFCESEDASNNQPFPTCNNPYSSNCNYKPKALCSNLGGSFCCQAAYNNKTAVYRDDFLCEQGSGTITQTTQTFSGPDTKNFKISVNQIQSWADSIEGNARSQQGRCWGESGWGDWREGSGGNVYVPNYTETLGNDICVNGNIILNSTTLTIGNEMYVKGNIILNGNAKINIYGPSNFEQYESFKIIADGIISTDKGTDFDGNEGNENYLWVMSLSNKLGTERYTGSSTDEFPAAIYVADNNMDVVFYAPNGSVILKQKGATGAKAMQVSGKRVILEKNVEIKYRTGILQMTFPNGPAQSIVISQYEEI